MLTSESAGRTHPDAAPPNPRPPPPEPRAARTPGTASPDDPEAPQWLADLRQHWPATSQSSESFYDFWNDVNDKCSLYLHAAARLASSSAQDGACLSDYQTNQLEATEKCRDRVTEALQQWQ